MVDQYVFWRNLSREDRPALFWGGDLQTVTEQLIFFETNKGASEQQFFLLAEHHFFGGRRNSMFAERRQALWVPGGTLSLGYRSKMLRWGVSPPFPLATIHLPLATIHSLWRPFIPPVATRAGF